MPETMLDYVRRRLHASVGQRGVISQATGVPYFTLAKIAQGRTLNPRAHTLQALNDYFRKNEPKLNRAS